MSKDDPAVSLIGMNAITSMFKGVCEHCGAEQRVDTYHDCKRSSATSSESMVTLAAKLEQVGHVPPDLQMTSEEAERYARLRYGVADEETESMRRFLRARDAYRKELSRGKFDAIGWETILVWTLIALSLVVSAALVWKEIQ